MILLPSRGWMGTRLKMARLTLRKTKGKRRGERYCGKRNRASNEEVRARVRLLTGPAREMRAAS